MRSAGGGHNQCSVFIAQNEQHLTAAAVISPIQKERRRGRSTTDGFRPCHPVQYPGRVHVEVFVSLLLRLGPMHQLFFFVSTRFEVSRISRQGWCQQALLARKESPQVQGQDTIALAGRSHINVFMGRLTTKDSALLQRSARQVSPHRAH